MKIYFANINEITKKIGLNQLLKYNQKYDGINQKRIISHCAGRYLVTNICKKVYNIAEVEIIIINNKPVLKNNELYFSISHSNDYIMCVFDNNKCGIDIEKIRPINIHKMSNRYHKNFKTNDEFFEFWTEYESKIKLQAEKYDKRCNYFKDNYIYTVTSTHKIDKITIQNYFDN